VIGATVSATTKVAIGRLVLTTRELGKTSEKLGSAHGSAKARNDGIKLIDTLKRNLANDTTAHQSPMQEAKQWSESQLEPLLRISPRQNSEQKKTKRRPPNG
jgi:hypothetical protein